MGLLETTTMLPGISLEFEVQITAFRAEGEGSVTSSVRILFTLGGSEAIFIFRL
jgi:hypothetical protein